jgi:hypothetical protein
MASELVICPYCNARLRLPGPSGPGTRAKCRVCKRGFTPTVVMAPAAPAAVEHPATAAPAAPPADAPRPDGDAAPPTHRKRQRIADEDHRRLKPYEWVLAITLVLVVLGGLGAYAWRLYQAEWATSGGGEGGPTDGGPVVAAVPPRPLLDAAAKPLPARLVGRWELRADDGTEGWMDLRADGTLTAFASSPEAPPLDPYEGVWALTDEEGDRYVMELGPARGGLGNHRVTLDFYEPDAFTLIETVYQGVPNWETRRFVRATTPAPGPGAPPP